MSEILSHRVRVARRFTRSIRVDADLGDPAALDGFICSQSAFDALLAMGRHREATGHSAFTWTGPYGSGKSSLAVALAALLTKPTKVAREFLKASDPSQADEVIRLFRPKRRPWIAVPLVGHRADAEITIAMALKSALPDAPTRSAGERFAAWVKRLAEMAPAEGIVLLIDEMGKFLEHAAADQGDIHVFQELAEIAARSDGRLIVIGILHQAFDEYAHRMSRAGRDEWRKIQGRFLDIPISLAGEEQIELISRAIESGWQSHATTNSVVAVAHALRGGRSGSLKSLEGRLRACWPLHPTVAALLGPVSRRRFGQSQRSIFGFLTSAEPFGFQEYLNTTRNDGEEYGPDRLWDYLRANLEPAILASPDGHRWSTAVDAVERCEARGGTTLHLLLLKAIALLDLFKDRSGLQPSLDLVRSSLPPLAVDVFEELLTDLLAWSVVVHRRHAGALAIYAGSDFDIEGAVEHARQTGVVVDYRQLARQAALQPVLAKRHYETTGALRWFEIDLAPVHEAGDRIRIYKPAAGAAGLFLLLVSTKGEPSAEVRRVIRSQRRADDDRLIVVGWTRDSFRVREMASELAALEHVRANRPELEGDAIARREVDARIARISADLEDRLADAIDLADWSLPEGVKADASKRLSGPAALSILASSLADWRYPLTAHLRNELVNRTRPSSNAAAATRVLLRAMVEQAGSDRLGMVGYPPEAGLFVSLIDSTGLYRRNDQGDLTFQAPTNDSPSRLLPLWEAVDAALKGAARGHTLDELFAIWRAPPFGVRDGLLGILSVAYLLTRRDHTAIYLDEVFRPQLDGFFVDRLLQEPGAIRLRKVEISDVDAGLVTELAKYLGDDSRLVASTPLDVAKGLVRKIRDLPSWTNRTATLSKSATALRTLALAASDPNQLLFEDLPRAMSDDSECAGAPLAGAVLRAIAELEAAYPAMLQAVAETLMTELRFKRGVVSDDYDLLQKRAINVRGLTGNFRLDALATRLMTFEGRPEEIEGFASLAANRPCRDWVDRDVDAARIELAALAQQFLKAEAFGHLKGRGDGRVNMVVYVSDPGYPEPFSSEIELDAIERKAADELSAMLAAVITKTGAADHVALGALAKLGLTLGRQKPESADSGRVV
ncbi:ATP-binding protein [Mesorhizobium sp.]|uniref:ATP-binding protein n=1 Tax=Mesorhizobium sp. TaxID=1871066 RepID=UPI000FE3C89F|nr:ATP-binding protein [Mesorhizobium sp.]RWQ12707.1 MAG: ATP-binding protein [Mesorhizobium sp.]